MGVSEKQVMPGIAFNLSGAVADEAYRRSAENLCRKLEAGDWSAEDLATSFIEEVDKLKDMDAQFHAALLLVEERIK